MKNIAKVTDFLFSMTPDELLEREVYSHTSTSYNSKRGEVYEHRIGAISSREEAKNRAKMILREHMKGGCSEDEALDLLVKGNSDAIRLLANLRGEKAGDIPSLIRVNGGPVNSRGLFYGSPRATASVAVKKAVGATFDQKLFICDEIKKPGSYLASYDGKEIEVIVE